MPISLNFEGLTDEFAHKLIYVVGSARGGSTFANRVIGLHPNLLYVGWNDKTFTDIWPHIDSLSDDELRSHLLHLPGDSSRSGWERLLDPDTLRHWNLHVERVCQTRSLRDIFCLRGIFYWLTQANAKPLSTLQGWCIKANTWQGVDELKKAIPETRVIFVVRDPRSTALSFAKVYARRRLEHFNDDDIIHGSLNWLRNATEFAVRLRRHKDTHLIYFEPLVSDPTATLNTLYARLGLPTLMDDQIQSSLARIEYSMTKTHEERGKRLAEMGVQQMALQRWRHQLSEKQLNWVCALTEGGAQYYGYEIDHRRGIFTAMQALTRAGVAGVKYGITLSLLQRKANVHASTVQRPVR